MPSYRILGFYSYAANLKSIKINEPVILKKEEFNIQSKNAIGVYLSDNKKIGYLPIENKDKNKDVIKYFKNSYKISKIELYTNFPLLEISRCYESTNFLEDIEFPNIKKLKYELTQIAITEEIKKNVYGLEKYLSTKKIKIKEIGITYYDENYINILIETQKGIDEYYTITNKYLKANIDKYEELVEYEMLDNTFYRNFLFHRLECYFEQNYKNIDTIADDLNIYNIEKKNVHDEQKVDIDECILYIRYKIVNDIYKPKNIEKYKFIDIIVDEYNLKLGKFYYDHNLKIYAYINFISNDILFEVSHNIKNIITKAMLTNKKIIIVYDPIFGTINKIIL